MIAIDHVAVLARDVAASARFLAEILGLPPGSPAGPDGEMFQLPVNGYGSLLYFPADHVPGQHIAFRVDEPTFDAVVDRLHARGVVFGNDPEDQTQHADLRFYGRSRTRILPRPERPPL